MFTNLPKSDVLPKIFVKLTQKFKFCSTFSTKVPYAYTVCDLSVRGCLRLQDGLRDWVHAVVCGNKTCRETKNALYLNEILHGKLCGLPLVHGRVLYKQTFMLQARKLKIGVKWS